MAEAESPFMPDDRIRKVIATVPATPPIAVERYIDGLIDGLRK
jgi:hypothetical protein